jgi:hypothetical protein
MTGRSTWVRAIRARIGKRSPLNAASRAGNITFSCKARVTGPYITQKTSPGHAAEGDAIRRYTDCASLAFWDAYWKADPAAKIYLQSDALPEFSHRRRKTLSPLTGRADRSRSSAFPHAARGSPSVPLTVLPPSTETKCRMARYSAFLGRKVEVQYRAGDILLPASGTFVADSGRSIFLEQKFEQRGSQKHFRWEIPYQYIIRLEEKKEPSPEPSASSSSSPAPAAAPSAETSASNADPPVRNSASSLSSGGAAPAILPLQNRPKTA